jgi:hypothetical protein
MMTEFYYDSPYDPAPGGSAQLPRDTDVLCIPAHPRLGAAGDGIELRRLPGGEAVALAFRSPQRLVSQLGPYQPWIGLPAIALAGLLPVLGLRRVLIDPVLDPAASRWTAQNLAAALEGAAAAA